MSSDFSLIVSHQDQVTELPEGSDLLAKSEFCPNAAFSIGEHILTFQGHPEFTNEYAYDVVCKRRDIIGEELFKRTEQSLLNETSSYLEVTNWWIEFFKYQFKIQS